MRISELVEHTGVPLATIKFYLREGMLPPGEAVTATRAEYGEEHIRRVRLIRALTEVAGLPLQRVTEVLALIDRPEGTLYDALGKAVAALPPYVSTEERDHPRARAALDAIGQVYDPRFAAVAQLDRALAAVESAGIPLSADRLAVYAEHLRAMAEYDLDGMPDGDREEQLGYAVLGTALYDPVIAALRRLAHQDAALRRLTASERPDGGST
jgi:DNA-binding transcriptional MerR regulator